MRSLLDAAWLVGVVCAVLAAAPAHAQVASSPAQGASAATTGHAETVLPTVRARAATEPQGRDGVQATTVHVGKGGQDARDIPQSLTVVTEKLIDDRNLDTVKDVLRNTAGVSFLAAEGGEEDIRLRGFALQSTGDVFVDGMRDPAFYDRDTFFLDQVEVLRGSASMLFGRGSTGGAVNQVSKAPRLMPERQVDVAMGNFGYLRAVGDFNLRLGEDSALRLGTMLTRADNNGSGSAIDKAGVAAAWATGIGLRHQFAATLYHLENRNGINYGLPYIRPTATASVATSTVLPVDPPSYYGMASDRNHGQASLLTFAHTWRLARGQDIVTRVRKGRYERDQRASTVRLAAAAMQPDGAAAGLDNFGPATVLTRGTQLKIQDLDTLFVQSDYSGRITALGLKHHVLAGVDLARENKRVYVALTAAQGGVVPTKPGTTAGAPADGATIDEDSRRLRLGNAYESTAAGLYAQDLVEFLPGWKALLGLRFDHLHGDYDLHAVPNDASAPVTTTSYRMRVHEPSWRMGLIHQPSARLSIHASAATSFNTSGDAYSLSAANASVPPEKSINTEIGVRWDSEDGAFTLRGAIFKSTKLHERNTDPTVNLVTLSGRRHAAGLELDLAGRLTRQWEVFASTMWLPSAKIDEGVEGSEGKGTRPSLTPRLSGTLWTTFQLDSRLRLGAGVNARSSQTPNRNPGFAVPRFVTADLMAEWQAMPQELSFKLNLSNITNKLYADQLYTAHYVPGAGRLLQLTGSYRF